MMTLEDYLNKHYTASTAKRYLRDITTYCKSNPGHKTARYSDIMQYLGKLRKQYDNPETIKCTLQGIKKYYSWLAATGQRNDHPCRFLNLKDKQNRDIQLQDLFSPEELEKLLNYRTINHKAATKNEVLLSLLIYQGLTTGELTRIDLQDVNLDKGEIYIKAGSRLNSRTLKLKPRQILLLHRYIKEARPRLLKTKTERLVLHQLGGPETGEGISYITGKLKHLFPERNLNPKTIRQSVIANLLKAGNDLRVVQVFAGHRYPSSTERYKQANVELLKKQVQKYHPLQ